MGWTHDYRDVARNRSILREKVPAQRMDRHHPQNPDPGIPHLLRRRARWFGARLRHSRG
ncbi:hypothetical protein ACWGJ2_15620 [Streptomyces sp. NPDC054796]|uniref:Uncharacterized protein n=1 Tax=Streptomyces daliensis TaxID=299421 RepID=A0A8T4J1Q5_9ACTN|nr:hypothetical protein [Streptomyces daliensis]